MLAGQVKPPVAGWAERAWWVPFLCWGAVVLLDRLLYQAPTYLRLGIIDEPAHFLTSVIVVLAGLSVAAAGGLRIRPAAVIAALLAGNLIDADHLPMVLGSDVLTAGTPRPYTHSITTVLALVLVAGLIRPTRRGRGGVAAFLLGTALGVAGHLFRDAGTSPVSVLWPVMTRAFHFAHPLYLELLLGLAAVPAVVRLARGLGVLRNRR
jgi:membrane-bound metal-dependent hydrolase YbcI (DUF457 family)